MPRLIQADTEEVLELVELIDMLERGPFDGRDEDCFASWGPALKKLANNRRFLADIAIAELKQRCAGQLRDNQYSPQVIMLHGRSDRFMIRANFWPAMADSVVFNSGLSPFFYGLAHDHNFSFLTVGYLGPGYWSEYYEYDYEKVAGVPGEAVDLRFVEKTRLDQGKVMLYRAHRDVHLQLPADEMSVSLNIVESRYDIPFRDQYRFDVKRGEVAGIITSMSLDSLLALSAHFGGENGRDLLDSFGAGHPSDRIRWLAIKARAAAIKAPDERLALFEQASRTDSRLVSAMASREAQRMESAGA